MTEATVGLTKLVNVSNWYFISILMWLEKEYLKAMFF